MNYRRIALQQAQNNIIHQQQLTKRRFDKNRSHPNFKLGDLVWLKVFLGRTKLAARYTGPTRIVQIISPVSFIVEDENLQRFQYYKQTRGGAMASAFTQVLGNIYRYEWEQDFIKHHQKHNGINGRYIDGIFMTTNHTIGEIKEELERANNKDINSKI
ncbi:unnamed protein product [Rotaria sordida]|uniref:Uncharacterized protein n=1 Tax=Rotaria sordida TaxID=392033 RepID=A0A819U6Z1_9BILA|nr:unnamed protein product [Rotaria sordida]